jgi:hypothetical protein
MEQTLMVDQAVADQATELLVVPLLQDKETSEELVMEILVQAAEEEQERLVKMVEAVNMEMVALE